MYDTTLCASGHVLYCIATASAGGVEERKHDDADDDHRHNGDHHQDNDEDDFPDSSLADVLLEPLPMSFASLDRAVKAYASTLNSDAASNSGPLVFASLPIIEVRARTHETTLWVTLTHTVLIVRYTLQRMTIR